MAVMVLEEGGVVLYHTQLLLEPLHLDTWTNILTADFIHRHMD